MFRVAWPFLGAFCYTSVPFLLQTRRGARFAALLSFLPAGILACCVLVYGTHPDTFERIGLGRTAFEFGPNGYRMRAGRTLYATLMLAYAASQSLLTTATIVLGMAQVPVPLLLQWGLPALVVLPVVFDAVGLPYTGATLSFVAGSLAAIYGIWVYSAISQISATLGVSVFTIPVQSEGQELRVVHRREYADALLSRANEAIADGVGEILPGASSPDDISDAVDVASAANPESDATNPREVQALTVGSSGLPSVPAGPKRRGRPSSAAPKRTSNTGRSLSRNR